MEKALNASVHNDADKRKFRVVNFVEERSRDGKAVIDLVPRTWVTLTSKKAGKCCFPPPPYSNLMRLVKTMEKPGVTWKKLPVMVLGEADNYEEGLLKCKKAEVTLSASTDDEGTRNPESQVSRSSLHDVPTFPDSHSLFNKSSDRGTTCTDRRLSDAVSIDKETRTNEERFDSPKSVGHGDASSDDSDTNSPLKRTHQRDTGSESETSTTDSPPRKKQRTRHNSGKVAHNKHVVREEVLDFQVHKSLNKTSTPIGRKDIPAHSSRNLSFGATDKSDNPDNAIQSANLRPVSDFETFWEAYVKKNLEEMESRMLEILGDKIDKSRRSCTHDLKKMRADFNQLRGCMVKSNIEAFDRHILDFEKQWVLPIEDMDKFEEFENHLKQDDKFDDFAKVLGAVWQPVGRGTGQTLNKSMLAILERYLSKDVAVNFSAQGKGKLRKANFSATKFYAVLEGVILAAEPEASTTVIKKIVGKILANASDWDGGRKERVSRRNDIPT